MIYSKITKSWGKRWRHFSWRQLSWDRNKATWKLLKTFTTFNLCQTKVKRWKEPWEGTQTQLLVPSTCQIWGWMILNWSNSRCFGEISAEPWSNKHPSSWPRWESFKNPCIMARMTSICRKPISIQTKKSLKSWWRMSITTYLPRKVNVWRQVRARCFSQERCKM
jgi:hypothetical protein